MGDVALNRHLTVMVVWTDPSCPACIEEEETILHFLGRCCSAMMVGKSVFDKYLINLLQFARGFKRFM